MKIMILKTIAALLIVSTSCTSQNNNAGGKKDNRSVTDIPGTIKDPAGGSDSNTVSVVRPLISSGTITVGGDKADVHGFTSEAVQRAIDAVKITGNGGTVILLPGVYEIYSPVRIYDNITLKGAGTKTVLKKCQGFRSGFAVDADYGELQVTVKDASGFKPGMGVAIYDDPQRSGWDLTTARITSIKNNTLYIDDFLVRDYRADKNGILSNACSVISAVNAHNITISDLTVDGSRETNDMIDGCRAGGIYLHKVNRALVENVTVKNFNCDGISWQITEYVTVRNCEVFGCANSGLHPGTGSPFTLIEGNNSHDNGGYGLYVCWRVRNGTVRNNTFFNNGNNGISTGHKDTDMLFADNHINDNGADGIYLRNDGLLNEPDRSIFRNNLIENNGRKESGYGLSVNGPAEGIVIENNTIRNTKGGQQLAAIFLSLDALPASMKDNKMTGNLKGDVINGKK